MSIAAKICILTALVSFFAVLTVHKMRQLNVYLVPIKPLDYRTKDAKIILFWTDFFGNPTYGFGLGHEPFLQNKCHYSHCLTTGDKSLVHKASAIIFHIRDVTLFMRRPPVRYPGQRYIFYLHENPSFTYVNLKGFQSFFNWTVTYRLDSSIFMGYGYFSKRITSAKISDLPAYFQKKTKPIAWFVSHCNTPNKREEYVRRLQKYIPVDIYGKCGPLMCQRTRGSKCYKMLEEQYFFYLSFENNICPDYATEKLYLALQYNIIPVVLGGSNYSRSAPPNSVINVEDFTSPRKLADYLKSVMASETKYLSYLRWKQDYVMGGYQSPFCRICEKLFTDNTTSVYHDIYDWWMVKGKCTPQRLQKAGLKIN